MTIITSETELERHYGTPMETSLAKVADHVTPEYRALIEASPFAVIATAGPEGLDCSPRGDDGALVRIHDDKTLMMPDRIGNNRIDSLRNIVRNPASALLFLLPGVGNTLRVNGSAQISVEPNLLQSFAVKGKPPRSVIIFTIEELYFQCSRAIVRSGLWDPAKHLDPKALPTPGRILAAQTQGRVGGEAYDKEWPARAAKSLW